MHVEQVCSGGQILRYNNNSNDGDGLWVEVLHQSLLVRIISSSQRRILIARIATLALIRLGIPAFTSLALLRRLAPLVLLRRFTPLVLLWWFIGASFCVIRLARIRVVHGCLR